MEIVKFPHPSLSIVCKEVSVFGIELQVILNSMFKLMVESKGLGLAANQVGLDMRMFVMQGPAGERLWIVNPKIINSSLVFSKFKEGCLSAPGEILNTGIRKEWVEIQYQDETGQFTTNTFEGLHSVCVQHEIEHLNGDNFMKSKYIPREKRKFLAKKWGLK